MRKSRLALSLAALTLGAAALPGAASAQTSPVPVTLTSTTPSRTLYVENMTGTGLTSLDFGSVRSLPFRVRVVDSSFTRTPFTVNATMTNLYLDNAGTLNYATKIPSSAVTLGSQTNPLNVLGVSAAVQPLVNTVSTITDTVICTTLYLVVTSGACTISTSGLIGNVQNLNVPVNLSALTNLPLLPQSNQAGAFTNAEFGAGTAGEFDTAGKAAASSLTPTAKTVISGSAVETPAVLSALYTTLSTTLSTLAPQDTVTAALRNQVGVSLWDTLLPAQVTTIIAGTVGTAQALIASQVLSQTGTYMSLPTLNVAVPTGIPTGAYKGTMVVTALQ